MKIPTIAYLSAEGKLSSSCKTKIPEKSLLKGYRIMCLTRHNDERMITLQRQGVISFAMSSKGEECCAVASAAALKASDWMYPQYREAGIVFWRGMSVEDYVNHMFCNAKDIILGRQMPNHFGSRELNIVTVSSPIGTKIPHAAGSAYAMRVKKEKNVAICYFGEGASSEGDFHVGLTFAAVRKAPVIFFCRNNGYAISTPTSKQFGSEGVAPEGIGHGITTYRVDGNDFFAVYETVLNARKECIQGKGPVLIEAMTYRMGAHSTSDDPSRYRDDKECRKWEKRCPILRLKRYLEKKKLWNEEEEKKLQKKIKQEVDAAIAAAKEVLPPSLETLIQDVYFAPTPRLREQLQELKRFFPGRQ
ncbi:2-oxoisovalerate dehydrogenase subunit alpha,mitochondrial [Waddlia chondrophila 2032/99]|nr:thiamine pyrophosphate-dependent enzyme [Waddlia chondrophila]CCB92000.1 2-oxoisovalerate dehydrogenase subunit alpha,mitochondrial [Waddlia chondrophila 2032/99]